MEKIVSKQLEEDSYLLYIHTPLCGTCQIARSILEKIESVHGEEIFYEMNANFEEDFLHKHKIESVPCLLIKENGVIKEKIYTFYSTGNIYRYLFEYKPGLFTG